MYRHGLQCRLQTAKSISCQNRCNQKCYGIRYKSHQHKCSKHGRIAGIDENAFSLLVCHFSNGCSCHKEHSCHNCKKDPATGKISFTCKKRHEILQCTECKQKYQHDRRRRKRIPIDQSFEMKCCFFHRNSRKLQKLKQKENQNHTACRKQKKCLES